MNPARELLTMLAQVIFSMEEDGLFYIGDKPHTLEQLVDELMQPDEGEELHT